ncbi:MAG: enolase, partial [Stenotrophomonas sp.]
YFIGDAVQDKDAQEHIAQMRESYAKARDYHATHGRLACYSRYGKGEPSERDYLDTLGGQISCGNWIETADIPNAFTLEFTDAANDRHAPDDAELAIIRRDGNTFFAVAEVAGYNWCATGADAIVMLYEPVSRTVLFSYDWS